MILALGKKDDRYDFKDIERKSINGIAQRGIFLLLNTIFGN